MIAATLEVQIQAEIAGFKKQLAEVVNNAKSEGENAAKGFRGKFNNWMQDSTSQIASKGMKILSPIAIAESLTEAINIGGEKGFVGGLEGLANSLPVIGTAYRLGGAIGNAIGDAISDADEMEKAVEEKMTALKSRMPAMLAQLAEDTQERETLATGGVKSAALDAQLAIQSARYIGDERLAITLENAEKEKELRTKTDLELAQTSSEAARAQIESNFAKEKELMQRLVRDKFHEARDFLHTLSRFQRIPKRPSAGPQAIPQLPLVGRHVGPRITLVNSEIFQRSKRSILRLRPGGERDAGKLVSQFLRQRRHTTVP